MNKTIMWTAVVILLVLVGGGLIITNQRSNQTEEVKPIQDKIATVQKDESTMQNSDRYVEFSKSVLDGSADKRRVLFFYANWCPTCRPTDADLSANNGNIPSDVTVIRVNYNDTDTDQEERDLAKKYQVTYQHTFVQIDGQGNAVTLWNGGKLAELLTNIK
jgi:thioredoxin 1